MQLRIRPTLMAVFTGLVVVTAAALAAVISNLSSRIVEELVDRRFQTIAESSAVEIAGVIDAATGVLHEQIRLATLSSARPGEPTACFPSIAAKSASTMAGPAKSSSRPTGLGNLSAVQGRSRTRS